ncbi:RpiB/LacA/LacB family sugar-phosphate isomerase [Candidatus Saccharibacteria bacterium]|nr:RpiB/LacA/LacB family sugar-phosphate isomerase [Candidatus Saccharibacteria bacterium]
MNIALATDHAGFEQLKELKSYLESLGHEVHDFGPKSLDPADDYPDFVIPAARAVASGECPFGIILGRSGQGEAMAANRIKGVRCGVFYGPAVPKGVVDASGEVSHNPYEIVRRTREHNDANMLSLAASYVTLEEMKSVIKLWLETPFSDEPRHIRRHEKLDKNS